MKTAWDVLEWARDGFDWGYDDDDVPSYAPEEWAHALRIAKALRLLDAFGELNKAHSLRCAEQSVRPEDIAVGKVMLYLSDAMRGDR